MQEIEKVVCTRCGGSMPKLRREMYGYTYCVDCSTEEAKVGIPVLMGEGDHTYLELQIIDGEVAMELEKRKAEREGRKSRLEYLNFEEDDRKLEEATEQSVHVLNDTFGKDEDDDESLINLGKLKEVDFYGKGKTK